MLSRDCRTFREEFTPGAQDPHREICPACAAYASALEQAAAAPKLPLPDSLRGQLRGVLPFVRHDEPRMPVAQKPLPAGLQGRLRAIAREKKPQPPAWVKSSRWAVAASYFLTVVLLQTLGDPVALGQRATNNLVRTWDQAWTEVRRERLPRIGSEIAQRYGAAVGSMEASLNELRSDVSELSTQQADRFNRWIDTIHKER
jgi:hypothetical protein